MVRKSFMDIYVKNQGPVQECEKCFGSGIVQYDSICKKCEGEGFIRNETSPKEGYLLNDNYKHK